MRAERRSYCDRCQPICSEFLTNRHAPPFAGTAAACLSTLRSPPPPASRPACFSTPRCYGRRDGCWARACSIAFVLSARGYVGYAVRFVLVAGWRGLRDPRRRGAVSRAASADPPVARRALRRLCHRHHRRSIVTTRRSRSKDGCWPMPPSPRPARTCACSLQHIRARLVSRARRWRRVDHRRRRAWRPTPPASGAPAASCACPPCCGGRRGISITACPTRS